MLRQLTTASLAAVLAACQTTAEAPSIDVNAELRREIHEVKELLAAQVAADSPNLGWSPMVTVSSRLEQLEHSIERLRATVAGTDMGGTREASFDFAGGVPAIDVLSGALDVFEQQRAMLCENIANTGVPGYRRRHLLLTTETNADTGMRLPSIVGERVRTMQGVLELTGNQLDFGVEGRGFFEVMLPKGELRYTRNGGFRQDLNGRLVTPEGYLLTDRVTIPRDTQGISVSNDGQVFGLGSGNTLTALGTIRLHVFPNPSALDVAGGQGFKASAGSGQPAARQPCVQGAGSLRQGYLERANLSLGAELIELQRVERQAAAVRRALAGYGIDAQ